MTTSLQLLQEKLKEGKVIPVIGAGVSQAAAGLPGWRGLIENGVLYAETRKLGRNETPIITEALKNNKLTEAALLLKKVLNAPESPFTLWLEDIFGNINYASKDLLKSIEELACSRILTTNYDTLLSSFSPIMPKKVLDWTQHDEVLRAMKKEEEFILHLHGIYEKPHTLIFGADDYKNLEAELGYKEILGKLWTSYHFLFIGCSSDGVMDDDFITIINFMNRWFPAYPHQHFIVLSEKDFSAGIHEDLIKKCRIEALSYGSDRTKLPDFVKQLDPEKTKFREKGERLRSYIDERLTTVSENPGKISELLAEVLPSNGQWPDSEQINILDEALLAFNKNITDTKQAFTLYQEIIKGLIKVSELEEKIGLWSWGVPLKPSEQGKFIEVAIIAFNALNRIPKTLMQEIRRRRPSRIHEYYFNGYLGQFVSEYSSLKEMGIDVLRFYESDEYFFENLKRIIDSLKNLLELKPEDVFEELAPPVACKTLPSEFVVYTVEAAILIVDKNNLSHTLASMPLEKGLPLIGMYCLAADNKNYILAYNSRYCLVWDPESAYAASHLFSSDMEETIDQVLVSTDGGINSIRIITNKKSIVYDNFVYKESLSRTMYADILKAGSLYIAKESGDSFYKGPCLFKSGDGINWDQIFTKQQLWNSVLEFSEIKDAYEEAKLEDESHIDYFLTFYPLKINYIEYDLKEVLICTFSYSIRGSENGGSCLLFINLDTFEILKKIYLPDCYSVLISQIDKENLFAKAYFENSKYRDEIAFKIQISNEETQILNLNTSAQPIIPFDSDVGSIDRFNKNTVLIKLLNNKMVILDHQRMLIEKTYTYKEHLGPLYIR